ncbi:hypothetical protein BC833DRAFT_565275 [Globomyces pollinis-pini]|nr:hypothetical protein BC833DRAFT_565275 [Globomyces pollinis-pini]
MFYFYKPTNLCKKKTFKEELINQLWLFYKIFKNLNANYLEFRISYQSKPSVLEIIETSKPSELEYFETKWMSYKTNFVLCYVDQYLHLEAGTSKSLSLLKDCRAGFDLLFVWSENCFFNRKLESHPNRKFFWLSTGVTNDYKTATPECNDIKLNFQLLNLTTLFQPTNC